MTMIEGPIYGNTHVAVYELGDGRYIVLQRTVSASMFGTLDRVVVDTRARAERAADAWAAWCESVSERARAVEKA